MILKFNCEKKQLWVLVFIVVQVVRGLFDLLCCKYLELKELDPENQREGRYSLENDLSVSFMKCVMQHLYFVLHLIVKHKSKLAKKTELVINEVRLSKSLLIEAKKVEISRKSITSTISKPKKYLIIFVLIFYGFTDEGYRFFSGIITFGMESNVLYPGFLLLIILLVSFILIKRKTFIFKHQVLSLCIIFTASMIIFIVFVVLRKFPFKDVIFDILKGLLMSTRGAQYPLIQILIDNYYFNIYLITAFQATFGALFYSIYFLASKKFNYFYYKGDSKYFYIKIIYGLLSTCSTLARCLTVSKIGFLGGGISDCFGGQSMLSFKIISDASNNGYFLFSVIICFIGSLIFNENIILMFCGFNRDVRNEIIERQYSDVESTIVDMDDEKIELPTHRPSTINEEEIEEGEDDEEKIEEKMEEKAEEKVEYL